MGKPRATLSKEQAESIYILQKQDSSISAVQVAEAFGIAPKTVRDIWNKRTWMHATHALMMSRSSPSTTTSSLTPMKPEEEATTAVQQQQQEEAREGDFSFLLPISSCGIIVTPLTIKEKEDDNQGWIQRGDDIMSSSQVLAEMARWNP